MLLLPFISMNPSKYIVDETDAFVAFVVGIRAMRLKKEINLRVKFIQVDAYDQGGLTIAMCKTRELNSIYGCIAYYYECLVQGVPLETKHNVIINL